MLRLEDLRPSTGARRTRRRVGRGDGSHGTYSGRGMKGQRSRAGFKMPPGFEGGQTPLWKRVPKRGFTNYTRKEFACVNLDLLSERFDAGAEITPEILLEKGIVSNMLDGLKILGRGEIDKKLSVQAHKFSKSAVEKIKAAGGDVVLLDGGELPEAEASAPKAKAKPEVAEEVEVKADASEEAAAETEGDTADSDEEKAEE